MKDFDMDLLTIADRFEEAKPTLMVTNAFNDDLLVEWRIDNNWVRLSFFKVANEQYVGRMDLNDDNFLLTDCSSMSPNLFELIRELSEALDVAQFVGTMSIQILIQRINAVLDDLLELEL